MDRSVEGPGRPVGMGMKRVCPNAPRGRHNCGGGPVRESERPIVAKKRVTTVERRGRDESMLL